MSESNCARSSAAEGVTSVDELADGNWPDASGGRPCCPLSILIVRSISCCEEVSSGAPALAPSVNGPAATPPAWDWNGPCGIVVGSLAPVAELSEGRGCRGVPTKVEPYAVFELLIGCSGDELGSAEPVIGLEVSVVVEGGG